MQPAGDQQVCFPHDREIVLPGGRRGETGVLQQPRFEVIIAPRNQFCHHVLIAASRPHKHKEMIAFEQFAEHFRELVQITIV